jgi:hypothetical protein
VTEHGIVSDFVVFSATSACYKRMVPGFGFGVSFSHLHEYGIWFLLSLLDYLSPFQDWYQIAFIF